MASLKASIRGHQNIFQFWDRFLAQDQTSATFALVGLDGIGKRKAAWAMMQQALCIHTPEICGECAHCQRVSRGQHESVLWIKPEGDLIKIDQSRHVLEFLSLRSLTARRFVVFERADALNQQAANALLKILEEPPSGTVFFLLTTNPTSLLPTIRSRSLMLRFRPLSQENLKSGKNLPEWMVQASRGSFSRLEQLSNLETQCFRKEAAELLLKIITDHDFLIVSEWRQQVKDRDFYRSLWPFWLELLRDALVLKWQRPDLLTCPDQMAHLKTLANYDEDILQAWALAVSQQERDLTIPRDPQLVLEAFHIQSHQGSH